MIYRFLFLLVIFVLSLCPGNFRVYGNEKMMNQSGDSVQNRELFIPKLNLLGIPFQILDIQTEIPVSKHYSIQANVVGSWWWNKTKFRGVHMIGGSLGARYWFKPQHFVQQTGGFFVGADAGMGFYDILLDHKGHKGNYLSTTLCAGYSHRIFKTLNLEYVLGAGMIFSSYTSFRSDTPGVNVWTNEGKLQSFWPTKAQVSLCWYIFQ